MVTPYIDTILKTLCSATWLRVRCSPDAALTKSLGHYFTQSYIVVLHICNYGYFSQVLRLKTFCFVEFWAHAGFDTIKALLTYLFCANAKIYKFIVLKTKLPEKLVVQSSTICNNIRLKSATVRPWDARFLGKEKTRAAQNSCNFCYLIGWR